MKTLKKCLVPAALLLLLAAGLTLLDTYGLFDHGVLGRWICYKHRQWELVFYRDGVFSFRGEKGNWEKMDRDRVRMTLDRGPKHGEFLLCRRDPETRMPCPGRGYWLWGGQRHRYYKIR